MTHPVSDRAREALADVLGYRPDSSMRRDFMSGNLIPIIFPEDAIRAMVALCADQHEKTKAAAVTQAELRRNVFGGEPTSTDTQQVVDHIAAAIKTMEMPG